MILTLSIVGNICLFFLMCRAMSFCEFFEKRTAELETWIDGYQSELINLYRRLKNIDKDDMFEKDDSVGFAFKEILDMIAETNNKINEYNDDNETINPQRQSEAKIKHNQSDSEHITKK